MPPPILPQKNATASPTASPQKEQTQDTFRQFLRQADKLIKEGQFDLAKNELAEAKKLEPTNPFIVAFEERIAIFKKNVDPKAHQTINPISSDDQLVSEGETSPSIVEESINREVIERKVRHEVEEEYRHRFTKELQRAEVHAAKILEEEHSRFEHQRKLLKTKYDEQLDELQRRYDAEYHAKLTGDVAQAEDRLKEQYRAKLDVVEEELKTQMMQAHETKQRDLEEHLKQERQQLLEQERASSLEREQALKMQLEKQLREELTKAEQSAHEQLHRKQQLEREQLQRQLTEEFQSQLQKERETGKQQYDAMKQKLEESFRAEQERMKEDHRRHIEEELNALRQREMKEFEQQRIALRQDVENELRMTYQQQFEEERHRMRGEAEATTEKEKMQLHDEYEAKLQKQEANIRTLRGTIQREMEQSFLQRMEQISREYDHKMELLGTKIPQSQEEKYKLYRERLRECYQHGLPTVDEAKKIMELKELLELTFDEHLEVETDVRLDLYVDRVEHMITTGELNLTNPNALDEVKQQFRVSAEESAKLEPYILSSIQRLAVKGRILVVDDDLLLLQTLDGMLADNGFQVIPAETVEHALELLKTTAVDLILSDIRFGESLQDGFQFFIAVQAQPHLRKIPFIFMSSLRDGIIIRSGVQLGVDDYLTKPIDTDLLIAVIEGKLKRYRNFQYEN